MQETQVTQLMWMSVMGNNPSNFQGVNLPVETVSWNDAQEFIQRLNAMNVAPAGFRFSLPTEAQWEYACRAGTMTAFSFGDTLTQQQAHFGRNQTSEVGQYPANAWGLRDMHGNVWEWVQDWFGEYPSGAVTDPTGASTGSYRVIRGGGWNNFAEYCRSAYRNRRDPSCRFSNIGFRLSLVFESR
jgi:formylglycine-generating enzyme required for sulfatase activity